MQQNLLFINEFEDHLIRIQNLELFQGTQSILNTNLQNNYQTLLNKTITYDENFIYQTTINNKLTDKVSEHQERLDIIGPCVHKINNDYVTHSEITGFASESAVTGLSISVGLLQTQCIAMDAGIAAAQSTATAAAATGAANSGLISTLQSQVVKLEGENAMLTSDVTEIKAEQTTIKVDAAKVAADLKKFEIGQGITDAGLQTQLTTLQTDKADKETTYTKQEVDAFLVTQSDTNTQLNGGILQLGSTKADQITTYTKTDIDNKLSLKANVTDVYNKTTMDGKLGLKANVTDVYTKANVDTSLALKSDKTYVDTGFNLYGGQLSTLKTRADNVDILNNTQNTNITNLQNSNVTLNNGMNTAFSRLQVIDNLNTQQSSSIVSLQTDNTTNKTDIGNLKTSDTKQNTDISALQTSDTKQNTDISALQTRCTDIETVNTTQSTILEIHTGNFGQINDNFTDIWGRLVKIEETDLTNLTKRIDYLDTNVGDMMPTVDFNNKWRMNEAVPKITALETDNTSNKTNITDLISRMNLQDQNNLTFGSNIYTLQTDNSKNKQDIFNINGYISNINNNITSIGTRVTNLETFVYNYQSRGEGWRRTGNEQTCYGTNNVITYGGGYAWVNFALPFTQICEYTATVKRTDPNGGGCDVIYCDVELGRIRIQHDFASTANMVWFNWSVTGFWR
ncbi:golgin_subfamily B member 1-like [Hexamita inflata]|uniref:Golgin subfamily B member 1-like n=1 Tax=Hexamita inflata TaxID=28002 RepID=A0AA86U578_9EUKA|nr:golgin subfamily B member 1-like [Hexamita inflata]